MKIKAAILVENNKPLIVDNIEFKEKLSFGQVLVKVNVSGICGSQIGEILGVKGKDKYLPHLLGHEGCGRIVEIGPGVKTLKIDEKVVLHWKKGSGINSELPIYYWNGKKINAGYVTTFNDYAVVSENRCTPISEQISDFNASLFGCAITTGFGVIENKAKLKIGESIVILGAGGIGLNIIQAAKLVSAYPIIAVDLYDNRLELAKKLGATHIINSKDNEFSKMIKNITGNNLDVFVDNTGNPKIIEKGYDLINDRGRLVLVGVPRLGDNINIFSLPLHFGKEITGTFGGDGNPEIDIPRYSNLILKGICDLEGIVTERYGLDDINLAISRVSNGLAAGRILIDF